MHYKLLLLFYYGQNKLCHCKIRCEYSYKADLEFKVIIIDNSDLGKSSFIKQVIHNLKEKNTNNRFRVFDYEW